MPIARNSGNIPFFIIKRNRSEVALGDVVQEAFVQNVFMHKIMTAYEPL